MFGQVFLPLLFLLYAGVFVARSLEKSFLLLAAHITSVPKLTKFVKFWDFDFGMVFGTLHHA